jgi:hypothetical protein
MMSGRDPDAAAVVEAEPVGRRRGHLLIAGTGRAGTTLLMRILTRLGLDTGFTCGQFAAVEANVGRAGLELSVTRETAARLPAIIKTPHIADNIGEALAEGWLPLDRVLIPVRELGAAAESRRAASRRAEALGRNGLAAPGGLWKTREPERQEQELAVQFHKLVEALVAHEVPMTLLAFPRFAREPGYFLRVAGPYLEERFGVGAARLLAAHSEETRLEYIGSYDRCLQARS